MEDGIEAHFNFPSLGLCFVKLLSWLVKSSKNKSSDIVTSGLGLILLNIIQCFLLCCNREILYYCYVWVLYFSFRRVINFKDEKKIIAGLQSMRNIFTVGLGCYIVPWNMLAPPHTICLQVWLLTYMLVIFRLKRCSAIKVPLPRPHFIMGQTKILSLRPR